MKFIVVLFSVFICCTYAKKIPDYLSNLRCRRSDPNFEKCIYNGFEKARPYFMQGIEELGFPPLDPFELPFMSVNRSLNDLVRIQAVCKNIRVTGGSNTIIDGLKADANAGTGEIHLTLPWTFLEMEYDVTGQLLIIPLQSKGVFVGNFTDTQIYIKGSVKRYQKDGEEYFRVNKLKTKITVGDGYIKLKSKNPELQFAADLITEFFNENPRRVMDAVNPIFIETANDLFRAVMDQVLATLPAIEWLPE